MNEISRQLIHLSGLLFVLLAQFMVREVAAGMFFLMAFTFLMYSFYIQRATSRWQRLLGSVDKHLRGTLMKFERPGLPFRGAFWFYMGCGLTFLFFPLAIATVACLILAIADAVATVVGHHFGSRKLVGSKTLEGTIAFILAAAAVTWVLAPEWILPATIAATMGELVTEAAPRLRRRGLLDDNLLIPLFVALVLQAI